MFDLCFIQQQKLSKNTHNKLKYKYFVNNIFLKTANYISSFGILISLQL